MKVVSIESGALGHIVPMAEIGPLSGLPFPDLIKGIGERYHFGGLPNWDAATKQGSPSGLQFVGGQMNAGKTPISIQKLTIHGDGIVIESMDTHHAEIVIDDLLHWATKEFSLRPPITTPYRWYRSSIVVIFDKSIDAALSLATKLADQLPAIISKLYGLEVSYSTSRFAISADPKSVPPNRVTEFSIERRIGSPYSENRYFSGAPVHTDIHLTLLSEIEAALK